MARKVTMAGLKRDLIAAEANTDKWHTLTVELRKLLGKAEAVAKGAEDDVGRLSNQIEWYEREREETQRYFDEALKLFKPHLVPNPATGAIEHPDGPLDRFLLQLRERISRYYDAMGHSVYRTLDSRR